MGRIRTGWALAKKSFAVLRADRSLLWFPIISGVAGMLALAIVMGPGIGLYYVDREEAWLVVFGVLGLYALTFVAIFCGTALAACAARSLEGHDTKVSEGLAAASKRIGPIAGWALVQTTVGLIIQALQSAAENNILGQILVGLISFAWSAVTFFVIPVIALEGLGPIDSFKRSLAVLRERWGESVVGTAAISLAIGLVGFLPGIALIAGGVALVNSNEPAAVALIVAGVIVIAIASLIGSALSQVFRVAVFVFATSDRAIGGFSADELQAAFRPRKLGRGR